MDGDKSVRQPLAIVGIGCRYPGGSSGPRAFWEMLRNGRDGVRDIPPDRWDAARFSDSSGYTPGTMRIRQGAFIDQPLDQFDAAFFGLSPREAAYFDPQLRLLMEVVWEAFEDAGIPPDSREGSDTGVYIGGFTVDFWVSLLNAKGRESVSQHTAIGGALVMLSNRLSHQFDLRGPSLTIDTACSSSLVALNYACRDLWAGRTSLAIVGGTNVMLRPDAAIVMSRGGFLSTDARSKAFDVSADGYGRGEGSGAILIKPLEQARADGDPIYAQIAATGVNQDGHTQGIAQPNGEAQCALICKVLDEAGSNGDEVVLLEAHGTGTSIGDPTEVNALARALRAEQGGRPRCIGSVKANISHQEAGAGIAGVIKTALCLRHGAVPPQPHVRTPNPAIPFDRYGFRIARALEPLPDVPGGVRQACVNSFGYGGTNAHVLLQEPPCLDTAAATTITDARQSQLLCLSARSTRALDALAEAYAYELRGDAPPTLADLCHTAGLRRQ
ncbi:MAG: polyketide synthase, partial [Rhodobacteraceae bacterium]|nr:polyketide synthase [Paracoccaceae bacterium]